MGARGPKKKPSALEELQGMPGRRPLNKREPKPKIGIPPVPSWLDNIGKYCFRTLAEKLVTVKVLTENDQHALAITADAYSEYRKCRKIVLTDGQTVELYKTDRDGNQYLYNIKERPEVKMSQSAWTRLMKGLAVFGLTPADRTRVNMVDEPEKDPLTEFMARGGKPYEVKK